MEWTYKAAGVDITAGEDAVAGIKALVKETFNANVLSELGLFGGCYLLPIQQYRNPVLVASTDGVGTKLLIAQQMGVHESVGQCLVNHCVNDILTTGAQPLFFLDYIGTGHLAPAVVKEIISGMAQACRANGCALIGGEMAEMPDLYHASDYDLVGTIVGIVERDNLLVNRVQRGDVLLGLPSSGLHTNGYTLARRVLLPHYSLTTYVPELGMTLGEALLTVHLSYLPVVMSLLSRAGLHAISHITGGGIIGNTRRVIPPEFELIIDWEAWQMPPIFRLIQHLGKVADEEMRRVFNLGIGLVLIVAKSAADEFARIITEEGMQPIIIGEVR